MLKREEAQKLLEGEQRKDWQRQTLAALAQDLSFDLRPIAYALLDRDEGGQPMPQRTQEERARYEALVSHAYARIGALQGDQRLPIFGILLPGIAPYVEMAWQLFARLPYQTGYHRKAFRLPGAGTATTQTRRDWLQRLVTGLGPYRHKDVAWLAAWAPYLGSAHMHGGYLAHPLGVLFAAALDAGGTEGEAVFEILIASARGEHTTGAMGRHVTTALLVASRPDGWDFVERLLLAAQREEGLRQVILETVDEAHPEAFRRMLRLILDHDLIRFSAVIRAADVWLGFAWTVDDARTVGGALALVLDLLQDPAARNEAISPPAQIGTNEPITLAVHQGANEATESSAQTGTNEPIAAGHFTASAARAARNEANARAAAAQAGAQRLYLALWAAAFEDTLGAIDVAAPALGGPDPIRRLAAAHLLGQLSLPRARAALLPLLDDPDLRVALCAFQSLQGAGNDLAPDLFERYERLLARLDDKGQPLASGIWPWLSYDSSAAQVADALLAALNARSPLLLIPYLPRMSTWIQVRAAQALAALPEWDDRVRAVFFSLASDRSSYVRDEALKLIGSRAISATEALPLEALLTRKSSETRRAILTMLLKQSDDEAFGSAARLLGARDALQRLAGLDLLRELAQSGRAVPRCGDAAQAYRSAHPSLSMDEQTLLTAIDAAGQPAQLAPTLQNALGLISRDDLTPVTPPRFLRPDIYTPAARACLVQLDALIETHRTTPVIVKTWQGSDEQLLGNLRQFVNPDPNLSPSDDQANLPLADLWLAWDRDRPASTRDADGLEVLRALLLLSNCRAARAALTTAYARGIATSPTAESLDAKPADPTILARLGEVANADAGEQQVVQALQFLFGPQEGIDQKLGGIGITGLQHSSLIRGVLTWLLRLRQQTSAAAPDFLLDTLEGSLALFPLDRLEKWIAAVAAGQHHSFTIQRDDASLGLLQQHLTQHPDTWTEAHHVRYWRLLHWLDRPLPGAPRRLPDLQVVLRAYCAGAATEADILDHLVASVSGQQPWYYGYGLLAGSGLAALSARAPHPLLEGYPVLQRLVPALRERILDLELARGEMPTPATLLARAIRHVGGAPVFLRLLAALASSDIVRGYQSDGQGRAGVLSYLLRMTYPDPNDGYEDFAARIAADHIEPRRLVAAAVYAPQWARYVERTLGWPQFEEAIWWIHAHTKDTSWAVDHALREAWQAQVAERTPLAGQDLLDGAVDVAWFWRGYGALGAARWEEVYAAAKYASSGSGHARARLFADAMLGRIAAEDLLHRISARRNQDAVRALGLLPLPAAPATAREADLMARYEAIQEFLRTGKNFGAQRRASEELAARIGLENLARTAGYPDPIRLQWAVETRLAADLRDGSLSAEADGVRVTLSLDPLTAEPALDVSKNGRPLKSLPARLKQQEAIAVLYARKREIDRQVARTRLSLEAAMCRGDRFTAAEIAGLLNHPVLARMLRNLIFIQDDGDGSPPVVLGYPHLDPSRQASHPTIAGDAHSPSAPVADQAASPRAQDPVVIPSGDTEGWRTFVYKDERSDKFWNIRLDGASYAVAYGRTGSAGQRQDKAFSTAADARREADRLIREKLGKGYVETTPATSGGTEMPSPTVDVSLPDTPPDGARSSHDALPPPQRAATGDTASTGSPSDGGILQFRAHDGSLRTVASGAPVLRLAHPHDLFSSGEWPAWQHECFVTEHIQPFKQVFRELYVRTENELRLGDEASSSRYAGQQVQPRQALALLGRRGWVSSAEEGVRRTFHDEGLTAEVGFDGGNLTPAEVEGLTVDRVRFARRGEWKPIPLAEVPPRVFSEVMRDLDLVVSVAHRGVVDPEATASTVEMRAALVRETCMLLGLANVAIKSAHVLVEGRLGSYSIHLGSAVVHRQPGGALCIVPVHSQHRGRIFLPFVDDDPRTAEVVSKVVLLARDAEIKDPSILEQIL